MPLVPSYWSFTSKFTFQLKKGWQICKAAYLLLVLPHWDSSGISLPIGFPVCRPERVTQKVSRRASSVQGPALEQRQQIGQNYMGLQLDYSVSMCKCSLTHWQCPLPSTCTLAFPTKLSPLSSSEEVGMRGHVTGFSGVSFWVGSAS